MITFTKSPGTKTGYTKITISDQSTDYINIVYNYDDKKRLQTYFNTSLNIKNPTNNVMPHEWFKFEFTNNRFEKKVTYTCDLDHISFHPDDDNNFLGRKTNVHFAKMKKPIEIIGAVKNKSFFPFFQFFNETKDGIVHIALIQDYQKSVQYKQFENILSQINNDPNILKTEEEKRAFFKCVNEGDCKEFVESINKSGLKLKQSDKESFENVANEQKFEIFDLENNYQIMAVKHRDIETIQNFKKYINVNKLNLILIGNLHFSAKTNVTNGEIIIIGKF
jgi:hypothetical protein